MISLDEALACVLSHGVAGASEVVTLDAALGRVLAQDIVVDRPQPPFDRALVDGFAVRAADVDRELTIGQTLAAQDIPLAPLTAGQCARIMTGAMVPCGTDRVVMIEDCTVLVDQKVRPSPRDNVVHIAKTASQHAKGEMVVPRATTITPAIVGIMATVGVTHPSVAKLVRVGVLSTGSELVLPTKVPHGAQIRDSNGCQLMAQLMRLGVNATYYGIAGDTHEDLYTKLACAFAANDLVLLSGGVSMGVYDLVPAVLRSLGLTILFDRVAMRPGKPTTFAVSPQHMCLALAGNPVSSFVGFELLAAPLIRRMMGQTLKPRQLRLNLENPISREAFAGTSFVPGIFSAPGGVSALKFKGSSHLTALSQADCLIQLPQSVQALAAGSSVDVRLL